MITVPTNDATSKNYLRYRDFFVDFLACLVPGIVFLILSLLIILTVGFVYFKGLSCPLPVDPFSIARIIEKGNKLFNFSLWTNFTFCILSYTFGFLLYRQDPKSPDHRSYLKNRKKISKYDEWVIRNDEGLAPSEVQYPYSNLANYLLQRGFACSKEVIKWDDKSSEDKIPHKNESTRSKAFINKLKIRIAYYFPEASFSIIKNEAHIRFASSMWYGFTVIIKMLYPAIGLILIYMYVYIDRLKLLNGDSKICKYIIITSIFFLILIVIVRLSDSFIQNIDHKNNEKRITIYAQILNCIYVLFDAFPVILSTVIVCVSYVYLNFVITKGLLPQIEYQHFYTIILLMAFLGIISFFAFFVKTKIESSFHYQRVREVVYVFETARLSRVFGAEGLDLLWEKINGTNEIKFSLKILD